MRPSLDDGELPLVERGAAAAAASSSSGSSRRRSTMTSDDGTDVRAASSSSASSFSHLSRRHRRLAALFLGVVAVGTSFLILSAPSRRLASSFATPQPLPPWAQPLVRVRVCDDSCPSANDGRCDDGRFLFPRERSSSLSSSTSSSSTSSSPSSPSSFDPLDTSPTREVKCDLGTDCSDCGGEAWEAWLPAELASDLPRPIAELRRGGRSDGGNGDGEDEEQQEGSTSSSSPRSSSFRVFATRTATDPPFVAVHADPLLDVDVSAQLASLGTVERGLTQVWRARLKKVCSANSLRGFSPSSISSSPSSSASSSPLVLDVGANFGYYSLFAASLGCRVVAWEPVPRFRSFFEAALLLNPRLAARVEVRGAAACDSDSGSPGSGSSSGVALAVPERGVWGTASVEGANIDRELERREEEERRRVEGEEGGGENRRSSSSSHSLPPPSPPLLRVEARCERVDATVERIWSATKTPHSQRKVALMKVDVEGFEPAALAGAARLFDAEEEVDDGDGSDRKGTKKFNNPFRSSSSRSSCSKFGSLSDVVLEYSPGIPERNNAWEKLHEWPAMLLFLKSKGFVLVNVPFGGGAPEAATAGEDLLKGDWESPLPSFEEVTLENLAADVSDAEKLRLRTLGCPLPRELFSSKEEGEEEGEESHATSNTDDDDSSSSSSFASSLSHRRAFSRCNAIPEQLHPHSFRATFGHNTNVWAARKGWERTRTEGGGEEEEGGGRKEGAERRGKGKGSSSHLLRLGRPVGVFGPFDPLTSWLPTTRSGVGMGGRLCDALPLEVKVAHRCPCDGGERGGEEEKGDSSENDDDEQKSNEASCRAREELVSSLAQKGLMPPLHGDSEASVALLGGRR